MGRIVCSLIEAADDLELAARVDPTGADGCLPSLEACACEADCVIDFSHHTAAKALTDWCVRKGLPLVLATTGQTPEEMALIRDAAQRIPVFYSANMSPAIAMLADMAAQAARLFPDADVEIVEAHHNRKVDAPSGTALILANAVQQARGGGDFVMGRSGQGKRAPGEIGIHSLRMGNEAGMHEVIICTPTQTITLKHEAHDRALFAEGALKAARFLAGRDAGLYGMKEMLG